MFACNDKDAAQFYKWWAVSFQFGHGGTACCGASDDPGEICGPGEMVFPPVLPGMKQWRDFS